MAHLKNKNGHLASAGGHLVADCDCCGAANTCCECYSDDAIHCCFSDDSTVNIEWDLTVISSTGSGCLTGHYTGSKTIPRGGTMTLGTAGGACDPRGQPDCGWYQAGGPENDDPSTDGTVEVGTTCEFGLPFVFFTLILGSGLHPILIRHNNHDASIGQFNGQGADCCFNPFLGGGPGVTWTETNTGAGYFIGTTSGGTCSSYRLTGHVTITLASNSCCVDSSGSRTVLDCTETPHTQTGTCLSQTPGACTIGQTCVVDEAPAAPMARGASSPAASMAAGAATASEPGPIAPTVNARATKPAAAATAPVPKVGPGTELKKLLAPLGLRTKAGCSCSDRAALMNRWGPDECERRIDTIIDWLVKEATKRRLASLVPFKESIARTLVMRAIERAREMMSTGMTRSS